MIFLWTPNVKSLQKKKRRNTTLNQVTLMYEMLLEGMVRIKNLTEIEIKPLNRTLTVEHVTLFRDML